MFANVDAEADLGSNVGAMSAKYHAGTDVVTFGAPIGHCAATAQSGEAGGTDGVNSYMPTVVFDPSNADAWDVQFLNFDNDTVGPTPFMLTVTCPS